LYVRAAALCIVALMTPVSAESQDLMDDPTPVHVENCQAIKVNDYTMQVGIDFMAVNKTATAVEFIFGFQDAFDSVATWYSGSSSGTFSPGVIIYAKHAALNNSFVPRRSDVENSAWEMPYSSGTSLSGIRCVLYKAKFADGTIWTNPAFPNVYPIPAN
jgi:hypothetical protein